MGPYKGNLLFTVDLFKKAEVKLGRACLFIGLAMTVSVIWHAMNKNGGKNELDVDLNVHILNLTVVFGWEDTSQTVIFL